MRVSLRRAGGWFLAAAALAFLAVLLTLRSSADGGRETILVARQAIATGTLLDGEHAQSLLSAVTVPRVAALPGVLRRPEQLLARRTAAWLSAGEPITEASLGGAPGLGPSPLEPGERAIVVPAAAAGGAATALVPGGRVDVVAASGDGATGRTAVVVADAEILGLTGGQSGDATGQDGSVLLRVSAQQALRLAAALNFAREVRLLARPGGDRAP